MRLLACPSQAGFHENTLHGSLCEPPLPVGQGSDPASALVFIQTACSPDGIWNSGLQQHTARALCTFGFVFIWEAGSDAISAAGHMGYDFPI